MKLNIWNWIYEIEYMISCNFKQMIKTNNLIILSNFN